MERIQEVNVQMRLQRQSQVPAIFLIVIAALTGLIFFSSPGTTDVGIWQRWINNMIISGPVDGFRLNQADYPPLASLILFDAYRAVRLFDLPSFIAVKLAILTFWWLTTLIFWLGSRSLPLSLLLYFSLLLNTLALGYIDILFAPALLGSLWMLKERRLVWFAVLFSLACLTKWQPVIIAPFIAVHLLGIDSARQWKQVPWKRLALQVGLPACVLTGLVLIIFGAQPVWQALQVSLHHPYLSGNALNLNWIITHFLHVLDPGNYGPLQNGLATYILTDSPQITLIPRLLFYLSYLLALVFFSRREKTFHNLVLYAILGFLAYFTFNTGVHENHLFLVTILAVVLYWLNPAYREVTLILILMANINLLVFYGVDGTLHFNRAVGGVDIALPLALFNVLFFCFYAWFAIKQSASSTVQPARNEEKRQQGRQHLFGGAK